MAIRNLSLLTMVLLLLLAKARAQEAALFSEDAYGSKPAIRYEQARGVFHYVVPCKQYVTMGSQQTERAVCWPASARRLRIINGKFDFSDFIPGVLTISATQVRFIPAEAKDMPTWGSIPVADIRFGDDPSKITRYLTSKDIGYKFGFLNYCEECDKNSTALDPAKDAQLSSEFQNVSEALTHFDQVYSRIADIATKVRFDIAARNQPTPTDPGPAMRIYSALNHELSGLCPAAVRSCLKEYEIYQQCKSKGPATNCSSPPSCTATCILPPATIRRLKVTECWAPRKASANLIPSWDEVFKQEDKVGVPKGGTNPIEKASFGGGGLVGMGSPQPGWATLAGIGASVPTMIDGYVPGASEKSCGVERTYERMRAEHRRSSR